MARSQSIRGRVTDRVSRATAVDVITPPKRRARSRVVEEDLPPARKSRPKAKSTPAPKAPAPRATAVAAADAPQRWEYYLALAALFLLGRTPILFFRERLDSLFGGSAGVIWQNDWVVRGAFIAVHVVVLVVAIWKANPYRLLQQPVLLLLLGWAWLSMAWSVEPGLTTMRSAMFIGTTVLGWYIGDRFSLRDQASMVAGVGGVGFGLSFLALFVWWDIAQSTNDVAGEISGIYVNRQLFSLVLAFGLLGTMFAIFHARARRRRIGLIALAVIEWLFSLGAGSRTGAFAILTTIAILIVVHVVRPWGQRVLKSWGGALACAGIAVMNGGFIQANWDAFLDLVNRTAQLTGRTVMWDLDVWFSHARPWQGWGFEAIWSHERAIAQARAVFGRYPYSAHNGFYEMLVGLGWVGFGLLVAFLLITAYRAFVYAWRRRTVVSLWPLGMLVMGVVFNLSESLYIANEAVWALTVAAAVSVSRRRMPSGPSLRRISWLRRRASSAAP